MEAKGKKSREQIQMEQEKANEAEDREYRLEDLSGYPSPNKKQKINPVAAGSRGQRAPAKTAWIKQETQAAVNSISNYQW